VCLHPYGFREWSGIERREREKICRVASELEHADLIKIERKTKREKERKGERGPNCMQGNPTMRRTTLQKRYISKAFKRRSGPVGAEGKKGEPKGGEGRVEKGRHGGLGLPNQRRSRESSQEKAQEIRAGEKSGGGRANKCD